MKRTALALIVLVVVACSGNTEQAEPAVTAAPTTTTVDVTSTLGPIGKECYQLVIDYPPEPWATAEGLTSVYVAGFALEGRPIGPEGATECLHGVEAALAESR